MIEVFLDILTRILQNQNVLMYAELKRAKEEKARDLLSEGISDTCALLGSIIVSRKGQGEKTKEEEKE